MSTSDSEEKTIDSGSGVKKKKTKKRPSDFEIFRTILTRTHERKLPWLLKDMGEDPDILFFCSQDEEGFTYGSPDISIAIVEITDEALKGIFETYLKKLHGFENEQHTQRVVNVRDQISEMAKTKGESNEAGVESNAYGTSWVIRKNVNGDQRTLYFSKAIESLYHVMVVKTWCESYRPLLTSEEGAHLYYPYSHPEGETASVLSLPPAEESEHPIARLYPNGFRALVTRGIDVILNKFLEDFPYPIVKEEMIVFQNRSSSVQIAHRIIADGWRMILLRPNAIFFPTMNIKLPSEGQHSL